MLLAYFTTPASQTVLALKDTAPSTPVAYEPGVDENFDHHILRALLRRIAALDVRTVQGVGLAGAPDAVVLEWASREGRVLVTHDVRTVTLSEGRSGASDDAA